MWLFVFTFIRIMTLLFFGAILYDIFMENLTIVFILPFLLPLTLLKNLSLPRTSNLYINLILDLVSNLDLDFFLSSTLTLMKIDPGLNKILFSSNHFKNSSERTCACPDLLYFHYQQKWYPHFILFLNQWKSDHSRLRKSTQSCGQIYKTIPNSETNGLSTLYAAFLDLFHARLAGYSTGDE